MTQRRIRLGMLTPSSNTVLEPATSRMLHHLPDVTAHFGRFRVTRIALSDDALRQFDPAPVLDAARLLADAHMDVIAWNGTSAGWLGFDSDERLCAAITDATGVPATSSVLALNQALHRLGARTLGLVTPYTSDVQQKIIANYEAAGIRVVAERHLNDPGNYSFAQYDESRIASLIRDVARGATAAPDTPGAPGAPDTSGAPDAITTLCTNMRAPGIVAAMEAETGIPILDSIAVVVWQSLLLAGADPARVQGWGGLFQRLALG